MIVATCRAYFRASMVSERSIGAVLDHMNELLNHDLTGGRFVTAAVGLIDPAASRMQLFSAGQAPMFFFDAARNRVQALSADHLPLGVVPAYAAGPPREIEFGPGDTLVLVTDGFLEWPDRNGEHFDEQRLAATICELRSHSAEELIKALYERVLEFSDGTLQRDDLTAVVTKRDE